MTFKINGHTRAFGSISTGTLRTEDLIQAFSEELERLCVPGQCTDLRFEAKCWLEGIESYQKNIRLQWPTDWDTYNELGSHLCYNLQDALDNLAPEGIYFGTLDGNGADFGWWRSEVEEE